VKTKPRRWWGNEEQAEANVTTALGSCRENNRPLPHEHPRKGTNTRFGQLDDALVRWIRNFIKINFKEKKFKTRILINFN
jgi:hypothetical protein